MFFYGFTSHVFGDWDAVLQFVLKAFVHWKFAKERVFMRVWTKEQAIICNERIIGYENDCWRSNRCAKELY